MQGLFLPTIDQLQTDSQDVNATRSNGGGLAGIAYGGSNRAIGTTDTANGGGTLGDSCFDLSETCLSGTYQWCTDPDGLRFEYDVCDRPAGVLDGSWMLSLNDGISTVYALGIGDLDLAGTASFAVENSCFVRDLSNFTATRPEVMSSIDGSVTYCSGRDPVGSFELNVVDGQSTFRMFVEMTEDGISVTVEYDGRTESCSVEPSNGVATC
jgi:hypothetical protein